MQLAAKQPDGATLRQHLQSAAAQGHAVDRRLLSQPPREAAALWAAFVALHGAEPIKPADLQAWQQLMGLQLTPWEAETLLLMDRATRVH